MTNIDYNWPIEEALCVIRFKPSDKWDLTAFGRFYSRIEDQYPKKEQMTIIEGFLDDSYMEDDNDLCEEEKLMRFKSNDETEIVQLSKNTLVINQLPPYPRWDKFKHIILGRIKDYCESFAPLLIDHIGLRYVNKFECDRNTFEIEKILSDNAYVPSIVFQKKKQFMLNFNYTNGEDYTNEIEIRFVESDSDDNIAILLDIEINENRETPIDYSLLSNELDELHCRSNTIFKSCISDKLKKEIGIKEEEK